MNNTDGVVNLKHNMKRLFNIDFKKLTYNGVKTTYNQDQIKSGGKTFDSSDIVRYKKMVLLSNQDKK